MDLDYDALESSLSGDDLRVLGEGGNLDNLCSTYLGVGLQEGAGWAPRDSEQPVAANILDWGGEEVGWWAASVCGRAGLRAEVGPLRHTTGPQLLALSLQDLHHMLPPQAALLLHSHLQALRRTTGRRGGRQRHRGASAHHTADACTGPGDDGHLTFPSDTYQPHSQDRLQGCSDAMYHPNTGHRYHTCSDDRYQTVSESKYQLESESRYLSYDENRYQLDSADRYTSYSENRYQTESEDNYSSYSENKYQVGGEGARCAGDGLYNTSWDLATLDLEALDQYLPGGEGDLAEDLRGLALDEDHVILTPDASPPLQQSGCSTSASGKSMDTDLFKKIPTNTRRRVRGPKSWEFLMRLLVDPRTNPALIRWEDEAAGTFRLVQPAAIAKMWGSRAGKPELSYINFARGLRYHYNSGALQAVSERQLVYRCGPVALQYLAELAERGPE